MKSDLQKKNLSVPIFIFLLILFFDRFAKNFVLQIDEGATIPIIKNVFHITFIYNTGAGFGFFQDASLFLAIFSIIILAVAVYYFFKTKEACLKIMLSVLSAGIIGNLTDRILYGKVIDFIDLRIWPVFNIADTAITLGILSIIVYLWIKDKKTNNKMIKKDVNKTL